MATGNHYWLDIAAGIAIATVTAFAVAPTVRRRHVVPRAVDEPA